MEGPNLGSFDRARHKFKESLPPLVVQELSICTLKDVRDVVRDLQQKHGQDGKLRNMNRLKSFIEAMKQFGQVVEVFLNASEFICFIWGPIKFLLSIAETYMDSFDKLMDAYSQIGDTIPGLLFYKSAFEKHQPLAAVLEDYYSDVLRFHSEAIRVFTRPKWKMLFHATWKTFDTEFGPILQSLVRRRELLESEKSSATIYEIQKARDDIEAMRTEQQDKTKIDDHEKHKARLSHVKQKLQATNYQLDQEVSTENRSWGTSGQWIFQDPTFESWENPDSTEHCVLYVHGKPGAGKTTLVSAVIEKLLKDKFSANKWQSVAYFYFKHDQAGQNNLNTMLRALLEQLIDQDPATSSYFFEQVASMASVNLRSTKVLQGLLRTALEGYQVVYLVLDGLDECAEGESGKIIEWLLAIANQGANSKTRLRVLISGQRDGVLDRLLSSQKSISLETSAHLEDIRAYTEQFCDRIQTKLKCPPSMTQQIISLVMAESKGMFLYAKVVLDNLWHQTRLTGLKQELQPGIFPRGLEKAYDRVVARILDHASEAERQDALRVLGLVTSARRLLFWREIQAFFCIDPINTEVDYDNRLQVSCKELCGSLLDTHLAAGESPGPEDIIQIVHETARQYLLEKNRLHSSSENVKLSTFCLQYLTSEPLGRGMDQHSILEYAKKGYYALQDYTARYWFEHLRQCINDVAGPPPEDIAPLVDLARTFLLSYGLTSKLGKQFQASNHSDLILAIRKLPEDGRELDSYLNISFRTSSIRYGIEKLYESDQGTDEEGVFTELHGKKAEYKCHKPWCDFFTEGFETSEERRRHLNDHDLPFRCPSQDCFASTLGFDSQSKLSQHQQSYHSPEEGQPKFPRPGQTFREDLCSVAARGDLEAVTSLLDSGEYVNQTSRPKGRQTALVLAAKSGHIHVCNLLLARGANVNFGRYYTPANSAYTALIAAVEARQHDVVRWFLAKGKPDTTTVSGALRYAMHLRYHDIVMIMLEAEDDTSSRVQAFPGDYLLAACTTGNATLAQRILPLEYSEYFLENCVNVAVSSENGVLELLLSTGHHVIKSPKPLLNAIREHLPSNAEAILSYPKLDLSSDDLRQCMDAAGTEGDHDTMDLIWQLMSVRGMSLGDVEFDKIPPRYKKRGDDWTCVFDAQARRALDVGLHHTLAHDSVVRCVCFSEDGKYLATGCDQYAQIYDVQTGQKLFVLQNDSHITGVMYILCVCFSPCGKYLATGADDSFIRVWDIQSVTIHHTFTGHEAAVYSIAFSHDGRTISSASGDMTVRLWDIEAGINTLTMRAEDGLTSIAFAPNTMYVAVGSLGSSVMIWDIRNGAFFDRLEGPDGHKDSIYSVAFSRTSHQLISGSLDKTIKVWEIDWSPWGTAHRRLGSRCVRTFYGHTDFVLSVGLTPDASLILSGSQDCSVRVWNQRTSFSQVILDGHKDSIISVACSPNGGYFATGSADMQVRIWYYL